MSISKKQINSTTGVVTFLDVLGWKGIWQRKQNAIDDLESLVSSLSKLSEKLSRGLSSASGIYATPTKVMIISDTIVIFTETALNNAIEAIELHGHLCSDAIPSSIKKGIPLRGATSFGQTIISNNNSIYAGKAIDEAASWHESANWIGVFLSPSANFIFDNPETKFWVKYDPPLKNNSTYNTQTVKWFDTNRPSDLLNIKKDFLQLSPIVPEVVNKFTNTIQYINCITKRCTRTGESCEVHE